MGDLRSKTLLHHLLPRGAPLLWIAEILPLSKSDKAGVGREHGERSISLAGRSLSYSCFMWWRGVDAASGFWLGASGSACSISLMMHRRGNKAITSTVLAKMTTESKLHLCWCAGGIIASLLMYSILQVRILWNRMMRLHVRSPAIKHAHMYSNSRMHACKNSSTCRNAS